MAPLYAEIVPMGGYIEWNHDTTAWERAPVTLRSLTLPCRLYEADILSLLALIVK